MSGSKNIYLLGYSGHAYVVIEAARVQNNVISGYFEKEESVDNPFEIPFLGFEREVDLKKIVGDDTIFPAIGSNMIRKSLIELIEENQLRQTTIIAASARVSESARIGSSSFVAPSAIVNSMSVIGKGCIINTGAIVEHECRIHDYSHIAPGAVLLGNVSVGQGTMIGANATVLPGVSLGANSVVGAGSVVLANIPENEIWAGNPARKLRLQ